MYDELISRANALVNPLNRAGQMLTMESTKTFRRNVRITLQELKEACSIYDLKVKSLHKALFRASDAEYDAIDQAYIAAAHIRYNLNKARKDVYGLTVY